MTRDLGETREDNTQNPRPAWFKRIFSAHHENDGRIYRCQCGELFTDRASKEFIKEHDGHKVEIAIGGNMREWIRIKLGMVK
jgi:hypothetical protein